jgi:hypothetical protein
VKAAPLKQQTAKRKIDYCDPKVARLAIWSMLAAVRKRFTRIDIATDSGSREIAANKLLPLIEELWSDAQKIVNKAVSKASVRVSTSWTSSAVAFSEHFQATKLVIAVDRAPRFSPS